VKILKQHPQTVFLIVGDGELKLDLERLTARLDLGTHVRFTGFRKDVPNILNLLDVYVLPSLFEGTPLGLLEAMLVQKSVVATLVASNGDIVEDRISGRLVEPRNSDQLADAIADLLANPGMAKKMGERARERVLTHFSLDRMIADYDALYRELLSAHQIKA
jgi:glycosyltransferase involved in cell wall biosynthesis